MVTEREYVPSISSRSQSKLERMHDPIIVDGRDLDEIIDDGRKKYPITELGQHRPQGSPLEKTHVYKRTDRNFYDTENIVRSTVTEENRPYYPLLGTSGAGAPLRDDKGEKITVIQADPQTRFQKHRFGPRIVEKALRYIQASDLQNQYTQDLKTMIKEREQIRKAEKEREQILNKMHKSVDYFGKPGAGAPRSLDKMDLYQGADLHQGHVNGSVGYTNRSVERYLGAEEKTRAGDIWHMPTSSGNIQTFVAEDQPLTKIPITNNIISSGSVSVREKKATDPFVKDLFNASGAMSERNMFNQNATYFEFGKPGNGAPLRDNKGEINARLNGAFLKDYYHRDWEENKTMPARNFLGELKDEMVLKEKRRNEEVEEEKKPYDLEMAEKIRLLQKNGYPRKNEDGNIVGNQLSTSDITRTKFDIRYPNPLTAKSYYDELLRQEDERQKIGRKAVLDGVQNSKQHALTIDEYWRKPEGHGAPYAGRPYGFRRGKLGNELHQGFKREFESSESGPNFYPSIASSSVLDDTRISLATQTETQHRINAPFATMDVYN